MDIKLSEPFVKCAQFFRFPEDIPADNNGYRFSKNNGYLMTLDYVPDALLLIQLDDLEIEGSKDFSDEVYVNQGQLVDYGPYEVELSRCGVYIKPKSKVDPLIERGFLALVFNSAASITINLNLKGE